MDLTASVLVIGSALAHATWNFLLKRSGSDTSFVGISKACEALFLLPIAAGAINRDALAGSWYFPLIGGVLVIANYASLAAAYRSSDLSIVYPISRGAMLAFLPLFGFVWLGERIDARGAFAILVVLVGIVLVGASDIRRSALHSAGTWWAVIAAVIAAAYTVWDKAAIQVLTPVDYFACYTLIVGACYAAYMFRTFGPETIGDVFRRHRVAIIAVSILNTTSYLLVLMALRQSTSSYVIALRQLSIVGGVVFGVVLLRESVPVSKALGVVAIVIGCVALAWAR